MKMTMSAQLFSFALLLSGLATTGASSGHKIGIEVWVHGSDVETPRHNATLSLRDATETAVARSAAYYLARANEGEIRITLRDDVILASDSNSEYVLFEADIARAEAPGRALSGFCRSDRIGDCAADILAALTHSR